MNLWVLSAVILLSGIFIIVIPLILLKNIEMGLIPPIISSIPESENLSILYISYDNLGLMYFNTGNYRKAKENYFNSLKANIYYQQAYNHLIELYFRQGKIEQAELIYAVALKILPFPQSVCNEMGIQYYYAGKYEQAVECYRKILNTKTPWLIEKEIPVSEVRANFALALNKWVIELVESGRYEEAAKLVIK